MILADHHAVRHDNNFKLIRFLLASAVIFSHSYELLGWRVFGRFAPELTPGTLAVDGFFLLSGYLIAQSWVRKPNLAVFLEKRFLRIFPGFVLAFITSILIGSFYAVDPDFWQKLAWKRTVWNAMTLGTPRTPLVFPRLAWPSANGSLWTIRYEFGCYLVIAALGVASLLARRWIVLALAGVCWTTYLTQIQLGPLQDSQDPGVLGYLLPIPRLLMFFLAGSCFYLFSDRIRYTWLGVVLAGGLSVVAVSNFTAGQAVLPITAGYLLFAFAFAPVGWLRTVDRWPDFSYGLYLYAWPLQAVIISTFRGIPPWGVFALSLPATIFLGCLSWYGIERRAIRWNLRRLNLKNITRVALPGRVVPAKLIRGSKPIFGWFKSSRL